MMPQAWQWLVQLTLALSYIHGRRVLHRDIKTQNVFLTSPQQGSAALLGDFGLAKQLQVKRESKCELSMDQAPQHADHRRGRT